MTKTIKVFLGSTKEAIPVAKAVADELGSDFDCQFWFDGVFMAGKNFLQALIDILPKNAYAILVLTAEDKAKVRKKDVWLPRDNVIFELGLFMGSYGKERVFVVNDSKVHVLSDMKGITTGEFVLRKKPENYTPSALNAIVSPAVKKVKEAITKNEIEAPPKLEIHYVAPGLSFNAYYARFLHNLEIGIGKFRGFSLKVHSPNSDSPSHVYHKLMDVLNSVGEDPKVFNIVLSVPRGLGTKSNRAKILNILRKKLASRLIFIDQEPSKDLLASDHVSFVGIDNYKVGLLASFALKYKLTEYKKDKTAIYGVASGIGSDARKRGFEQGVTILSENGKAKKTVIRIPLEDRDRFDNLDDWKDVLTTSFSDAYPLGIFAGNDENAAAAIRAAKEIGRRDVYVVGCDATREMRTLVIDKKTPSAVATIDTKVRQQIEEILLNPQSGENHFERPELYPKGLQTEFQRALNKNDTLAKEWQRRAI